MPAQRTSYFFSSRNKDRLYGANSFGDWLAPFFTSGVFNGCFPVTANDDMSVSLNGGQMLVNGERCGFVNIDGRTMKQVGIERIDIATASGNLNRIDRIMLRRDNAKRDIYPLYVVGELSNKPTPPPMVREHGITDYAIYNIHVDAGVRKITQDKIEDLRMKKEFCGWVASAVGEIDFEQVTRQFEAFFSKYEKAVAERYILYDAVMAGNEGAARASLARYNALLEEFRQLFVAQQLGWSQNFQAEWAQTLTDWFQDFRNTLTEEQAVQLFNKIYDHENTHIFSAAAHGIRVKNRRIQMHVDEPLNQGWHTLQNGEIHPGMTCDYVKALGRTCAEWALLALECNQVKNMLEVEA